MSLSDDIRKLPALIKESYTLTKGETATKLLPKDTSFAITGQLYELKSGQNKVSVLKPNDFKFHVGYIAVVGNDLKIITRQGIVYSESIKDLKVVANDPDMKETDLVLTNDPQFGGLMVGGEWGNAYTNGKG